MLNPEADEPLDDDYPCSCGGRMQALSVEAVVGGYRRQRECRTCGERTETMQSLDDDEDAEGLSPDSTN